jgi:cytoskeletal protein RodZ
MANQKEFAFSTIQQVFDMENGDFQSNLKSIKRFVKIGLILLVIIGVELGILIVDRVVSRIQERESAKKAKDAEFKATIDKNTEEFDLILAGWTRDPNTGKLKPPTKR